MEIKPETVPSCETPMAEMPMPTTQAQLPRFRLQDIWMALLVWLAMYLRIELGSVSARPMGGFLYALGLLALSFLYIALDKKCISLRSYLAAGLSLLFAAMLLLGGRPLIMNLCYMASFVCWLYFLLTAYGASGETRLGQLIGFDVLKMYLVLPFASFSSLFAVLFRKKRGGKGGKTVLWVILGLILAVIPVLITLAVFSADDGLFSEFLSKIKWPRFSEIMKHIGNAILALLPAMWMFGLFTSLREKKCEKALGAESHARFRKGMRFLPSGLILGFIIPLLLVYAIYIGFTLPNIFAAFSGTLPTEYTASRFAREGFGSMCFIGAVNTAYAYILSVLHKRPSERSASLGKWTVGILSLLNLLLSAQAAARLWLYISRFGLSLMRIYAAWFILLLSICFIWILIRQFRLKFPTARYIVFTGTAMLLLLAALSPVRLMAWYNTNMVENSTWNAQEDGYKVFVLQSDMWGGGETSIYPEAVPYLARLPRETVLGVVPTWERSDADKEESMTVGALLDLEYKEDAEPEKISVWERLLRFNFTNFARKRALEKLLPGK